MSQDHFLTIEEIQVRMDTAQRHLSKTVYSYEQWDVLEKTWAELAREARRRKAAAVHEKHNGGFTLVEALYVLLSVSMFCAIIYAIVHFVIKFW